LESGGQACYASQLQVQSDRSGIVISIRPIHFLIALNPLPNLHKVSVLFRSSFPTLLTIDTTGFNEGFTEERWLNQVYAEPPEEPIPTTDFTLYAEDYTFPTDFANYAQQYAEVALPLDGLCSMPGAGCIHVPA
jgi:hypothetical protein